MASSVIKAGSVEQDKTFASKRSWIQTQFLDINDDRFELLRLGFQGVSNLCYIPPSDPVDELHQSQIAAPLSTHNKNLTVLLPTPVGPMTLQVEVIRKYAHNYFSQPQLTE